MPRIVGTVKVRMGSERLPGKTLRMVAGKPLLGWLLHRAAQAMELDAIVVATPDSRENDAIAAFCDEQNTPCFRGSENDTLARLLGALESQHADIGVEMYGDGPLTDPRLIDECVRAYVEDPSYDLVGNDLRGTYPSGLYVEAFSVAALRKAAEQTHDPAIREHGTLCLRQNSTLYKLRNIEAVGPLRRPEIHLDVDTEEDFQVIEAIVKHFAPRTDFSAEEIIVFLDAHPEIARLNREVHRRWKQYQQPAEED